MFFNDLSFMLNSGTFDYDNTQCANSNESTLDVTPLMTSDSMGNNAPSTSDFAFGSNNHNNHDNGDEKMVARANSRSGNHSSNSSTSKNVPKCVDKTKTLLPEDFEPSNYSIICGNKRKYFNSIGNRRLRLIVQSFIPQYSQAKDKVEKGVVVTKVMSMIREACGGSGEGAFVTFEDGRWWEVSERTSREKVGSLFRDCLAGKYKSSARNKIAQRKCKREAKREQQQRHQKSPAAAPPEEVASFEHPQQNQQQQQQRQRLGKAAIDECDSSVSSGNASFYDVDDLSPVPLQTLTCDSYAYKTDTQFFSSSYM